MAHRIPELSIVVPCHNEADNLRPLVHAIRDVLESQGQAYELIITDDGSSDDSWEKLTGLAATDGRIRGLRFRQNCGQSAAIWAGIRAARGRYIVTMDADLQNSPADLPEFVRALQHADCICGSRVKSRGHGDNWIRIVSSRVANWVRNALTGENISDAGCGYRAFDRACVANLKFFKGMHRFLPTLIKMEGFSVAEIAIATRPRTSGSTHYGVWNRLFASFYDLLAVRWMQRRMIDYQVTERLNEYNETLAAAPTSRDSA